MGDRHKHSAIMPREFNPSIAVRLMQNYVKLLESSHGDPTLFQRNYYKQTPDDIVGELADRSSPIGVCQRYVAGHGFG